MPERRATSRSEKLASPPSRYRSRASATSRVLVRSPSVVMVNSVNLSGRGCQGALRVPVLGVARLVALGEEVVQRLPGALGGGGRLGAVARVLGAGDREVQVLGDAR